jgi:hypothetical protein
MSDEAKCDFCSSTDLGRKKAYQPRSQFFLDTPELGTIWKDVGAWVACSVCSELIDREQWSGLMKRAQEVNPGLRAAKWAGKLRECSEFVATSWSAVLGQPPEVFLDRERKERTA